MVCDDITFERFSFEENKEGILQKKNNTDDKEHGARIVKVHLGAMLQHGPPQEKTFVEEGCAQLLRALGKGNVMSGVAAEEVRSLEYAAYEKCFRHTWLCGHHYPELFRWKKLDGLRLMEKNRQNVFSRMGMGSLEQERSRCFRGETFETATRVL